MTAPGRFIVFEGLDGAGTTTQARLLAEWLQKQGRTVYLAHQPSEGPVGLLIRQILAGRAATPQADGKLGMVDERVMALLFAADRLDHLGSQIEPRLARGEDVILDRYTLSSLAYQGSTVSHEFINQVNRFARRPDLTLFLYVPASVALERVRSRGAKLERYETAQQLALIEREYSRLVGTPLVGHRTLVHRRPRLRARSRQGHHRPAPEPDLHRLPGRQGRSPPLQPEHREGGAEALLRHRAARPLPHGAGDRRYAHLLRRPAAWLALRLRLPGGGEGGQRSRAGRDHGAIAVAPDRRAGGSVQDRPADRGA